MIGAKGVGTSQSTAICDFDDVCSEVFIDVLMCLLENNQQTKELTQNQTQRFGVQEVPLRIKTRLWC